jgi:hypothetical protein
MLSTRNLFVLSFAIVVASVLSGIGLMEVASQTPDTERRRGEPAGRAQALWVCSAVWNRELLQLVRQAGLEVNNSRRFFYGIFHQIEAAPGRG